MYHVPPRTAPLEPPPIHGVRRSYLEARGVRFHLTESGPADGAPVLALHGWPQHHYAYRHLLAHPPAGMRVIAPDLPGYGWSGPYPHRWEKEEVVSDLLALLDAMGIERTLLVGHDWGGYIGHLMVLREPERVQGYLALNIVHPWQTPGRMLPHMWRFLTYQPAMATIGVPLQRYTRAVEIGIVTSLADRHAVSREDVRWFADRFRAPLCARAGRDTYRTFWMKEIPASVRAPETRRSTVTTRCLFGTGDVAIHPSLASSETAIADDYQIAFVENCGHFIADERPDIVRAGLIALAAEVGVHPAATADASTAAA